MRESSSSGQVTLPDASQEGLQRFLALPRDRKTPLLSVSQARPGLEEVFLRLIREEKEDAPTCPRRVIPSSSSAASPPP
jgi:hypothetical protein